MSIHISEHYLMAKGFSAINVNQQIKGYTIVAEDVLKMCVVVDNTAFRKYTCQELANLENNFRLYMKEKGYEKIEILFWLYTDDVERDRVCIEYLNVWILDKKNSRVLIFDNQPLEFEGIDSQNEEIFFEKKKKYKLPMVSIGLILINIFVFILLESYGSTLDAEYMLGCGASSWQHEFKELQIYRLFTCMFIHFGMGHLFNNMIMLYIIGEQIEKMYGKARFIVIYIVTGLISSVASSVFNMFMEKNDVISGGASGAIYGIMGALVIALWFNKNQLRGGVGRIILVITVVLYGGFVETGVDNVAHIAGFVSGIIMSGMVLKLDKKFRCNKPS